MKALGGVVAVLIAGCSDHSSAPSKQRVARDARGRETVNADAATSPVAGDSAAEETLAPTNEDTPTVVYARGEDGAIVLVCGERVGKFSPSCFGLGASETTTASAAIGPPPMATVLLGNHIGHYCHAGPADTGPPVDALLFKTAPPEHAEFFVSPPSRASGVSLEMPTRDGDLATMTSRAKKLLEGAKTPSGPLEVNKVEVKSKLKADLDGDNRADTIYSVSPTGDDAPLGTVVFAELSTRPHELVEILVDTRASIDLEAALDVDRDGHDELMGTARIWEGGESFVLRFDGKRLQIVGRYGCAE